MEKLLIILFFVVIAIIGNLFFNAGNDIKDYKLEIDKSYLPPGPLVGFIWIIVFGILGLTYSKIDSKKDKNNYSKLTIILFIIFCFMYGPLTMGKSSRYIKNYNYLALIFLFYLSYMLNSSVKNSIYYLFPIFLWIGYVALLTLMDDLRFINFYLN